MRVISLLRPAVARPRRRPIGALVILTVILGVVVMHSMSGSPASHAHHVPHGSSAVAAPASGAQVTAAQLVAAIGTAAQNVNVPTVGERSTGACHDGCGGHDLATAMCLMILIALLALAVPARRLLWRAPLEWSMPLMPAPAGVGAVAAPSLHELCISRT
ncbi:hypothetical protein GCM10027059_44880 [Myceligenerans halotolerans]